jgi:antitoxin component HigA of HigAB toxin-antitoxin module
VFCSQPQRIAQQEGKTIEIDMKTLNEYIESTPEEFRQEELILETTELICKMMNQNGMSKSELATKLKKSKAHISQCLSGEQNLTLRTLADVFGALGYRMQVGATPLDSAIGKPISRLYPIGGWSFEKACNNPAIEVMDCAANADESDNTPFELREAAA